MSATNKYQSTTFYLPICREPNFASAEKARKVHFPKEHDNTK